MSERQDSENHSSEAPSTPKRTLKAAFPYTPPSTLPSTPNCPKSGRKNSEYGDRIEAHIFSLYLYSFIPQRISDPAIEFQRLTPSTTRSKRKQEFGDRAEDQSGLQGNEDEEEDTLYKAVLESTMFPGEDRMDRHINAMSPEVTRHSLLNFKFPSKSTQSSPSIDSPFHAAYSVSPISMSAQTILGNTRPVTRDQIDRGLYKVLDAPKIREDFYLNLLDWSSTNILGVGLDSAVFLWNARSAAVIELARLKKGDLVASVNWSSQGTHIAVGSDDGYVFIYDTCRLKMIRKFFNHTQRVGCLAWHEHILTSGSRDSTICHIDVRAPDSCIDVLRAHTHEVCGLKWSRDGQLASGGNDNQVYTWDHRSSAPIYNFTDHKAAIKAIVWSPHTRGLLATGGGSQDQYIRFWTTYTGDMLGSFDTGSQVANLAWSKNVDEIVSTHGFTKNEIIVWKYPSMDQLAYLTGHDARVLYLAAAPDGKNIVTGSGDETLRFWRVFSQKKQTISDSKLSLRGHVIR
ncbi:hypothetical protein G9A89_002973 [Geosiphon pyriformis]|nr:hypothetical protein G9A89_002973 [Geosiphon pyriformis]